MLSQTNGIRQEGVSLSGALKQVKNYLSFTHGFMSLWAYCGKIWKKGEDWSKVSTIWKGVSHRSRLNEVLGEQKGGGTEGMRISFSQNMTGPFASVTINCFRCSLFACFATSLISHIVAVLYRYVQVYVFELRSRSFFTAVSYAPWFCVVTGFQGSKFSCRMCCRVSQTTYS